MKKITLTLFVLGLALLACSISPEMPTTGNAAEILPTKSIPSPIPTIPIKTEPAETPITPEVCTVSAAESLHMRDAPTIKGNVIIWLFPGDQLTILPDPPVGVWVKVTTADNLTGWVNSIFCEVTQ